MRGTAGGTLKEYRIERKRDKMKKNMPYKIKDVEGNVFVFSCYENGYPVYRTNRGNKHIFENDIHHYTVIEQNAPQ